MNKISLLVALSVSFVFMIGFADTTQAEESRRDATFSAPKIKIQSFVDKIVPREIRVGGVKSTTTATRRNTRNATTTTGQTVKDRTQERRVKLIEEAKKRTAERREKLAEKAKERIKAYAERIIKRMNAALDRLEKIGNRVETRLDKLEEKGVDVLEARTLLEQSRREIADSRDFIAEIESKMQTASTSDNPREAMETIRGLLKEARESIKGAHKALVEAIKAAKASVKTAKPETVDDSGAE